MVETKGLYEEFLKAEEVSENALETTEAIIVSEGEIKEHEYNGEKKKALTIKVRILATDEIRLFQLNKTNYKTLSKKFGSETLKWIGKQIGLYQTMTQSGKLGVIAVTE